MPSAGMTTITNEKNMQHYGYQENKPALQKRLKRIEGQVRGVSKMVEDDKYCIDILTQVSAVKAALDKVALELLRDHARHCLSNDHVHAKDEGDKADELVNAIGRML
jgi:CsoR family transcriptional regulator, copper-sensing transcriptional repressor